MYHSRICLLKLSGDSGSRTSGSCPSPVDHFISVWSSAALSFGLDLQNGLYPNAKTSMLGYEAISGFVPAGNTTCSRCDAKLNAPFLSVRTCHAVTTVGTEGFDASG